MPAYLTLERGNESENLLICNEIVDLKPLPRGDNFLDFRHELCH